MSLVNNSVQYLTNIHYKVQYFKENKIITTAIILQYYKPRFVCNVNKKTPLLESL